MKWVWRRRNDNKSFYKDLFTTPALEPLHSAICDVPTEFDVQLRQNDILFLWDLLKHIGNYETGLFNTEILNRLLDLFGCMRGQGKTALDVFFEAIIEKYSNSTSFLFSGRKRKYFLHNECLVC